ncbi:Hypothetical protein NTJ_12904 [Nesidiocoris tenuis]|uniref:Uncharacterized protein n=1 Tax=Nesidiocoris tenuis TaxID=355587 RepID=A0ABN7BB81_9HEMI|nr:Hypothetical protein NTJ_12904 [Nesidiocoris tenuis]
MLSKRCSKAPSSDAFGESHMESMDFQLWKRSRPEIQRIARFFRAIPAMCESSCEELTVRIAAVEWRPLPNLFGTVGPSIFKTSVKTDPTASYSDLHFRNIGVVPLKKK